MKIRFVWNGIKIDGKLHRAWYSTSKLINSPEGTITIYSKEYYPGIPEIEGLQVQNDSDGMTDYFEKDRIRVEPSNSHYSAVVEAVKKQETHNLKVYGKLFN
uniref:Uncharacterized protein n=1 Tax=viral metagenome TaxID=1070528 RepID=A0A6H1ZH10_9ZZZZ